MEASKNKTLIPILAVIILAFIFVFPRIILSNFDPGNPWACYLYQYGFGLVTFLVGLLLVMKTGSLKLGRGRDTFWFIWIVGGFFLFAGGHALWILIALNTPVKG